MIVLLFLSKSGRVDWEIWHPKQTRMGISGIIYRLFLRSANIVWDQSISNCLSQNDTSSFWSNRHTPLAETEVQKVQPSQVFHTTANFTTKRSNMSLHRAKTSVRDICSNVICQSGRHDIALHIMPEWKFNLQLILLGNTNAFLSIICVTYFQRHEWPKTKPS